MEKNPDYNYGILVSLDHGVANRPDFHLEFRNGCPLIFLHRVKEQPQKILIAISVCKLINKNKDCIDITSEENRVKIQNLIKPTQTEFKKIKNLVKKNANQMNQSLDTLAKNFSGVLDLLSLK